jgi:hypothetical protein
VPHGDREVTAKFDLDYLLACTASSAFVLSLHEHPFVLEMAFFS